MCGQPHAQRRAARAQQRDRAVVGALVQSQPAVLAGDLDAERAQPAEPVQHLGRHAALTLDALRIHLVLSERAQLHEELLRAGLRLRVRLRMRMDQIEPEPAEEQLPHEARQRPFALSRRLRDRACFAFRDLRRRRAHRSP